MKHDLPKTEAEWKTKLSPEQYAILREKGTEAPGTGKYLHETRDGIYRCAACGNPLFNSDAKFDSGSGPISPSRKNFLDNKITIQFIHRGLAYTLFILVIFWFIKASKIVGSSLFSRTKIIPLLLVVLQILLGIATVVLSPYGNNLVWFGVIHQLVAILFLISIIFMMYLIRSSVFRKRIFLNKLPKF